MINKKKAIVCFLGVFLSILLTFKIINRNNKDTVTQNYSNSTDLDYQGIDVSNHQGEIIWSLVASDDKIKFVYIKATEGKTHQDKRYKKNLNGARKNGFPVGSYHYLRNTSYILDQFDNFVSVVDKDLQDLIPMVDVEEKVEKDSILLF